MVAFSSLVLALVPLAIFVALFSGLASWRNVPLTAFWTGVAGAVIPWIAATGVVLFAASLLPQKLQQAGVMSALFPGLGTLGVLFVGAVASVLVGPEHGWKWRLQWFAIVSAVPAVLLTAGLVVVFLLGDRTKP